MLILHWQSTDVNDQGHQQMYLAGDSGHFYLANRTRTYRLFPCILYWPYVPYRCFGNKVSTILSAKGLNALFATDCVITDLETDNVR